MSPVLEFVEQALDEVAQVAPGRDDGFDVGFGEFPADGIGIIVPISQQRLDLVSNHSEHWAEALDVVALAWCQDKGERAAFGTASCVEFGAEPVVPQRQCRRKTLFHLSYSSGR